MPTNYTLIRPASVPQDISSVQYTKLADGRMLMTYAAEVGGVDRAYFIFLDENLLSQNTIPVYIGDIETGSKVKAVATPDGGFGVVFDELPAVINNTQSVHRYTSSGVLLQDDWVFSNTVEAEIAVDADGNLLASSIFRSGFSDFFYGKFIPVFGSSYTVVEQIEGSSDFTAKVGKPIVLTNGFVYVPTVIVKPGQDRDEIIMVGTGLNSNPPNLSLTTSGNAAFGAVASVEASVLADGNVLVVFIPEAAAMEIHVYDPTLTNLVSSQTVGFAATSPVLRLLEQDDGSFVALNFTGVGMVQVFDISADGQTINNRGNLDSGINTSSAFLEGNGLDVFNMSDGGFGIVASLGTSPASTETITIFDQGTAFTDVEQMSATGRFNGQAGGDFVRGTNGGDTIIGGTGGDALWGEGGEDRLYMDGERGDPAFDFVNDQSFDIAWGGLGDDRIQNDTGNSEMYGGFGKDTMIGGTDGDKAWGGEDQDTFKLGDGDDTAYGDRGGDIMVLGDGDDVAFGGAGNDFIRGNHGDDDLFGQASKDVLKGGLGADSLEGGGGGDTLMGGAHNDTMRGDNGADVFDFKGDGNAAVAGEIETDVIEDFESGTDTIRIRNATGVSSFGDLDISSLGDQTVIEYGDRQIFVNVAVNSGDFVFV